MIACVVIRPAQGLFTHADGSVAEQHPVCCQPGADTAVHVRMRLKSFTIRPAFETDQCQRCLFVKKPHLDRPHFKIKSSCFGTAMEFSPACMAKFNACIHSVISFVTAQSFADIA